MSGRKKFKIYGLRAEQLRRVVHKTRNLNDSNRIGNSITLLKPGLDSTAFHLGFTRDIESAHQVTEHYARHGI